MSDVFATVHATFAVACLFSSFGLLLLRRSSTLYIEFGLLVVSAFVPILNVVVFAVLLLFSIFLALVDE